VCAALKPLRPLVRRWHLTSLKEIVPIAGDFSVAMPGGRALRLMDSDATGLYFEGFPEGYEAESVLPWFLHASGSRAIVDVGAHVGLYSLFAAMASPEAVIYAFEPVGVCATQLERNLAANGLRNISVVRAAVSDTTGTDLIYIPRTVSQGKASSTATLSRVAMDQAQDAVECPHVRLDDFVRREGLRPELIKADVEGCNARVLRGMVETLEAHSPILYMEFLPLEHPGMLPRIAEDRREDVVAAEHLLDQVGYRHKYLATMDGLWERPDIRGHTDRRWWNWCLSKQPLAAEFGSRAAMRERLRAFG
jgi:FkbM family methyltransferase